MSDQDRIGRTTELFLQARELKPEERGAFLAQECLEDPDLRADVESLLVHDEDPFGWLSSVVNPRSISRYRTIERIGEGGMGEVWLAEQTEPVHRQVAMKILKPGMDSKEVLARFEAERQALALMDHPNVTKILDAGTDDRGHPFFVMDYVKGVSITEYCDRHRLTIRQRLELFLEVCEGVEHAHEKGLIHRDLKPSNVLVSVQGGKPVPKVIDFGIAKATEHSLTQRTRLTQQGLPIGTLEYMSPEQIEMAQDVDTRTDVYSLGLLLYELLVGTLPFDRHRFRISGLDDLRRRIRDDDPPKPSNRFATLGEASTDLATKRRTDPPSLIRQLRGDLDWITARALARDRARRYGSPRVLAADIVRHLNHEPVLAGPPSVTYRFEKFVRRYPLQLAAAALALLLVGILMGGSVLWRRSSTSAMLRTIGEQRADLVVPVLARVWRQFPARADEARLLLEGRSDHAWSVFEKLPAPTSFGEVADAVELALPLVAGAEPLGQGDLNLAASMVWALDYASGLENLSSARYRLTRASIIRCLRGRIGDPDPSLHTSLKWRRIPAGWFVMGSSEDAREADSPDERPARPVTIASPFWISEHEITNAEYAQFDPNWHSDDYPAVAINWYRAYAYAAWLGGPDEIVRLPTEAEWEYAAWPGGRHGLDRDPAEVDWQSDLEGKRFPWGSEDVCRAENCRANVRDRWAQATSASRTPVCSEEFNRNDYGLCDVAGNVFEWVADWYGRYPEGQQIDPWGPPNPFLTDARIPSSNSRVHRGGGYTEVGGAARVANRGGQVPQETREHGQDLGFRVVRRAHQGHGLASQGQE